MDSDYLANITKGCGIRMTVWGNIVGTHFTNLTYNHVRLQITPQEYEDWRKEALFDALRGLRYGQSFCNKFNITDNILFYALNQGAADAHIRSNYVA